MANLCIVPNCKISEDEEVSFYSFPDDESLKALWLNNLKITSLEPSMKVCSKHFESNNFSENSITERRLKTDAVPSKLLDKRQGPESSTTVEMPEKRSKLNIESSAIPSTSKQYSIHSIDKIVNSLVEKEKVVCFSVDQSTQIDEEILQYQNPKLPLEKSCQCNMELKEELAIDRMIKTSDQLLVLTGIHSFTMLGILEQSITLSEPSNLKDSWGLSAKHSVIATFMILRMNASYKTTSIFLETTPEHIQEIFIKTIDKLEQVLSYIILWPQPHTWRATMPSGFDGYTDTRVIIFSLEVMAQNKEANEDLKFLIGISPPGLVMFISKAFSASVSNKQLFLNSEILDRLQANERILIRRDFDVVKECEAKQIKVTEISEAEKDMIPTVPIARYYAEKTWNRVQMFKALKGRFSEHLRSRIDSIVMVIASMATLSLARA